MAAASKHLPIGRGGLWRATHNNLNKKWHKKIQSLGAQPDAIRFDEFDVLGFFGSLYNIVQSALAHENASIRCAPCVNRSGAWLFRGERFGAGIVDIDVSPSDLGIGAAWRSIDSVAECSFVARMELRVGRTGGDLIHARFPPVTTPGNLEILKGNPS